MKVLWKNLCWARFSECFLTEARCVFLNKLDGENTALGSTSYRLKTQLKMR